MSKCSGVPRGGAEALQCLQRNVAGLSPACRSAVSALTPKPAAPTQTTTAPAPPPAAAPARPAPAATATTPPATAPASRPPAPAATAPAKQPAATAARPDPAPPRTARPAPQPRSAPAAAPPHPAAAPAPAVAPTPQQQSAIRFTCQRDFMVNCRGVTPGGPEALACLQRNAARLSPDCRMSLAAIEDGAPVTAATSAAPAPVARPGPFPLRRAIRERLRNQ